MILLLQFKKNVLHLLSLKVINFYKLFVSYEIYKKYFNFFKFKNKKDESRPSAKLMKQWGERAQNNLLRYQKTGKLPKNMFIFNDYE